MKILSLEFSSAQRSVAVLNPPAGAGTEVVDTTTGQTMKPFAMIEAALRSAGLEREEIEGIAVGRGPGSYTGIRVAISLAQGWQLAHGVKLLGVSSAEGIAAQAQAEGLTDKFSVVIDAQRGEFYLAGYEISAHRTREVSPLRLASLDTVRGLDQAGERLIGPEITRWVTSGRVVFPSATALGKLALARTEFFPGERLEPIYLRATTFVKAPPPRLIS